VLDVGGCVVTRDAREFHGVWWSSSTCGRSRACSGETAGLERFRRIEAAARQEAMLREPAMAKSMVGRTDAPIEANPMSEAPTLDPTRRARLQQMYGSLSDHAMAPLWESLHSLVKPTPAAAGRVPAKWDYARGRAALSDGMR